MRLFYKQRKSGGDLSNMCFLFSSEGQQVCKHKADRTQDISVCVCVSCVSIYMLTGLHLLAMYSGTSCTNLDPLYDHVTFSKEKSSTEFLFQAHFSNTVLRPLLLFNAMISQILLRHNRVTFFFLLF